MTTLINQSVAFVSVVALALFYSVAPLTVSADVVVDNENSAEVTNTTVVEANTGNNHARTGEAGDAEDGGDADGDNASNEAGNGGDGGNSGDTGNINTGGAVATSVIQNDVNTTRTNVRTESSDCECGEHGPYDERLEVRSSERSSQSLDYSSRFLFDDESSSSESDFNSEQSERSESSAEGDAESDASTDNTDSSSDSDGEGESESSSESESWSETSNEESESDRDVTVEKEEDLEVEQSERDDYELIYQRNYRGDQVPNDDVVASNDNDAEVDNTAVVLADTGNNSTRSGEAGNGDEGGDADGDTDEEEEETENTAGDGGDGGDTGDTGNINTGVSDSFSETVNVVNRSVTRVRAE